MGAMELFVLWLAAHWRAVLVIAFILMVLGKLMP